MTTLKAAPHLCTALALPPGATPARLGRPACPCFCMEAFPCPPCIQVVRLFACCAQRALWRGLPPPCRRAGGRTNLPAWGVYLFAC